MFCLDMKFDSFDQLFAAICEFGPRNSWVKASAAAAWLGVVMEDLGLEPVQYEEFKQPPSTGGEIYSNLQAIHGNPSTILTAHYDSLGPTCGACDNVSGVAVALWAGHLRVRAGLPTWVALFACEEPPFFHGMMGSRAWVRSNYAASCGKRVLVLDSLGYMTGRPPESGDHPSRRVAPERELAFLTNHGAKSWYDFTAAMDVPKFVDTTGNRVRGLSDVRNMDSLDAALVLDSTTMACPFHTKHDTPDKVDVAWLRRVAEDLSRL